MDEVGISVAVGLAAFSNFTGVVWTHTRCQDDIETLFSVNIHCDVCLFIYIIHQTSFFPTKLNFYRIRFDKFRCVNSFLTRCSGFCSQISAFFKSPCKRYIFWVEIDTRRLKLARREKIYIHIFLEKYDHKTARKH